MQINNNLNSMVQLEKKLEQSANELSKLSLNNEQLGNEEQKDLKKKAQQKQEETPKAELPTEMVKQIDIPIAYNANAEVISTQSSINNSTIDIKV